MEEGIKEGEKFERKRGGKEEWVVRMDVKRELGRRWF